MGEAEPYLPLWGGWATFNYQSDRLYAAIVLSSSLSILLFLIVVVIERRLIRY